jgi:hypothetical protein
MIFHCHILATELFPKKKRLGVQSLSRNVSGWQYHLGIGLQADNPEFENSGELN